MKKGRDQKAYLLLLMAVVVALYLVPLPKTNASLSSSSILPSTVESMKVAKLIKSSQGFKSSNVIIFALNDNETAFSDRFYWDVHRALNETSLKPFLDYYILKREITSEISKALLGYVKRYFPYISYMKDLLNQFDAISIYVVEQMNSLWKLKRLLENLNETKATLEAKFSKIAKAVNSYEEEFLKKEEETYLKLNESEHKLLLEVRRVAKVYDSTLTINYVFTKLYLKFKEALERECSNGTISVRKISLFLENSTSPLERSFGSVFSNAFLDTAAVWPTDLNEICKDRAQMSAFIAQTLARFVSLAPKSLSKDVSKLLGLKPNESEVLITIALSLGPNAKEDLLESAVVEALKLIYGVPTNEALLLLKSVKGDREAEAQLVLNFMKLKDPCFEKAVYESLLREVPLTIALSKCEARDLSRVLDDLFRTDPASLNVSLSYRGLSGVWVDYFVKEKLFNELRALGVPADVAFRVAFGNERPNEYYVLYSTLNATGSLYAKEIAFAMSHAKDFEQAKKMALIKIFRGYLNQMEANGLSPKAAELLLNYLLAWTPGLNDQLINQITYKVVMLELMEKSSSVPLARVLFKITDVQKFVKELVYCPDSNCALTVAEKWSRELANDFLREYTAYELLTGIDGRHPVILLNSHLNYSIVSELVKRFSSLKGVRSTYFTGTDLLNEDVKTNVNESLNEVNLYSTIAVLIVLLVSTRSLKLTFIPLIIILLILRIYNFLIYLISTLTGFKPSAIDLIVATATVLGVGIDYTLYAASRSREIGPVNSMKPILLASGVASIGFAIFGLLSALFLPSLSSLGLTVPLAIMLTSTLGSLIASSIADVLEVEPLRAPRKRPWLTALSIEFPRLTVALALILAVLGILTLRYWPPGYDLLLFLPSNAPSVKGLMALEKYSSPGFIGPTVIALELKDPNLIAKSTRQVDNLAQYFLESGYFDYAFTVTRPLGKFITYDYEALKFLGGDRYVVGKYVLIYLLPHYPPDSNVMIDYVKYMRSFLEKWIRSKNNYFQKALVGGESALNYDLSNSINNVILNYMTPLMVLLSSLLFVVVFKRLEFIVATTLATLVPIAVSLGLSNLIFRTVFTIPMLWLVVPLLVTATLSIGSDYLVFYLYGIKEGMSECKVRMDGECANMLNVLLYASSKLSKLVLGFALTFSVAYLSMIASKIWALREIGLSIGLAAILLLISIAYTIVPALLALVYRRR